MCASQRDQAGHLGRGWSDCVGFVVMCQLQTVHCVAVVSSLSLISSPQIQPSEGAAAQTTLAANTGVLARPSAQAGVRVGDRAGDGDWDWDRDGAGCTRGLGAGGHSCAGAPCVRLASVYSLRPHAP